MGRRLRAIVTAIVMGLGVASWRYSNRQIPFDPEVWCSDRTARGGTRLRMVDDIMRRDLLMRRTRLDLQEIFGTGWQDPTGVGTIRDEIYLRTWDLAIDIGCRDWVGNYFFGNWANCSSFLVRFGQDGRTSEYALFHSP